MAGHYIWPLSTDTLFPFGSPSLISVNTSNKCFGKTNVIMSSIMEKTKTYRVGRKASVDGVEAVIRSVEDSNPERVYLS